MSGGSGSRDVGLGERGDGGSGSSDVGLGKGGYVD